MRQPGRLRRVIAALAVSAAGLLLAVAIPAPASAAGSLELSSDGVSFSPAFPANLFDGLGLLAPGDSLDASLWIKNAGSTPAELRVRAMQLVTPSPEFASAVTLTTVHAGATATRSLDALGTCSVVVPSMTLAAGAVTRVDMSVAMSMMIGGNATQNQAARLDFAVDMRDAAAGPYPASGCDPGASVVASRSSSLPSTGVDSTPALLTAFALLVIGTVITLARRRRRHEDRSDG